MSKLSWATRQGKSSKGGMTGRLRRMRWAAVVVIVLVLPLLIGAYMPSPKTVKLVDEVDWQETDGWHGVWGGWNDKLGQTRVELRLEAKDCKVTAAKTLDGKLWISVDDIKGVGDGVYTNYGTVEVTVGETDERGYDCTCSGTSIKALLIDVKHRLVHKGTIDWTVSPSVSVLGCGGSLGSFTIKSATAESWVLHRYKACPNANDGLDVDLMEVRVRVYEDEYVFKTMQSMDPGVIKAGDRPKECFYQRYNWELKDGKWKFTKK